MAKVVVHTELKQKNNSLTEPILFFEGVENRVHIRTMYGTVGLAMYRARFQRL